MVHGVRRYGCRRSPGRTQDEHRQRLTHPNPAPDRVRAGKGPAPCRQTDSQRSALVLFEKPRLSAGTNRQ
ncbi:MAG: hypothetical protein EG826_01870 [Deltaproteobacteria bacterium]|nr:hypothetical protein [Deltaproteobacteria bacterium]